MPCDLKGLLWNILFPEILPLVGLGGALGLVLCCSMYGEHKHKDYTHNTHSKNQISASLLPLSLTHEFSAHFECVCSSTKPSWSLVFIGRSNQGRGLAFAGVGSLWWTPKEEFYLELCLHQHPFQKTTKVVILNSILLCFYFMFHA